MKTKLTFCIVIFLAFCALQIPAQYAPGVGLAGCNALHKDSSAFVNWASACRVKRGYQDISSPSLGYASVGDSSMALGKAENNGIVSLGDGGWAICTFPYPIKNGAGPDFAIFENGFDNDFLELAVVEVSSDGINFTRFKAHSLSDTLTQTASFGYTDASKINNLAGKYKSGYGTPFDLQELANTPGLNVNAITHVKITDVVGSMNRMYATYDGFGNKINDPWPTPFPSGGFDLDAVGVINEQRIVGVSESSLNAAFTLYPHPLNAGQLLQVMGSVPPQKLELLDLKGEVITTSETNAIETNGFCAGLYILKISTTQGVILKKVMLGN